MSQSQRQKRLRLLVSRLNQERKRQGRQVDILCNDLIAAQRGFVARLDGVGFAAGFYKALLGASDLRTLLKRAARLIERELGGAGVAFFLRLDGPCEHYPLDGRDPDSRRSPQECFTGGLAERICKSNRRCTTDDLVGMGLEGDLQGLNGFSIATLPLNDLGRAVGFLLVYRPLPGRLTNTELQKVGLITCGLSQAIRGCRAPVRS